MHTCNAWCADGVHAILSILPEGEAKWEVTQALGPALAAAMGLEPVGQPMTQIPMLPQNSQGFPTAQGKVRQRLVQWAQAKST